MRLTTMIISFLFLDQTDEPMETGQFEDAEM